MGIVPEIVNIGSQRLLAQHSGLRGLFLMDEAALARVCGLGEAKPCG